MLSIEDVRSRASKRITEKVTSGMFSEILRNVSSSYGNGSSIGGAIASEVPTITYPEVPIVASIGADHGSSGSVSVVVITCVTMVSFFALCVVVWCFRRGGCGQTLDTCQARQKQSPKVAAVANIDIIAPASFAAQSPSVQRPPTSDFPRGAKENHSGVWSPRSSARAGSDHDDIILQEVSEEEPGEGSAAL